MADERGGRHASNVLSKLPKKTMQEMKEAFQMIDNNRDGIICVDDLKEMYSSFGRIPPDEELQEMVKEAPGPINFTMFLNLFGEKLSGTDSEDAIRSGFKTFDELGEGGIPETYLKKLLCESGRDRVTPQEWSQLMKEGQVEQGKFKYMEFVGILKGKEKEEKAD